MTSPDLLNQLRIDGDTALGTSITNLTARTASTEADIIDLENALATETGARAQAIQQVTAKLAARPNIQINGGFENGTAGIGWGGSSVVVDDAWGRSVRFIPGGPGTQVMVWPSVSVFPGKAYTFSGDMALFMADGAEPVQSFFAVDGFNGATPLGAIALTVQGKLIGTHDFDASDARRQAYAISFETPSNCDRIVIKGVVADPVSTINYWSVRQGKLELGSLPATTYSAEAAQTALAASVTEHSLALIDLELQQALASYQVEALATGGLPAFLSLISSSLGGYAALAAPVVALLNTISGGSPLVALEARNGEVFFGRPIYIAFPGTDIHLIVGATGTVETGTLLWFGSNTISAGQATRSNGVFALGTDGRPYLGNEQLQNGGSAAPGSSAAAQGNFSGALTTGGWDALKIFTVTGVPNPGSGSIGLEFDAPQVSGNFWGGDIRVVEVASGHVVGQAYTEFYNMGATTPVNINGALTRSGTVQYRIEGRRTSGTGQVDQVSGRITFEAHQII
mgnify:CR=1 FL=1